MLAVSKMEEMLAVSKMKEILAMSKVEDMLAVSKEVLLVSKVEGILTQQKAGSKIPTVIVSKVENKVHIWEAPKKCRNVTP